MPQTLLKTAIKEGIIARNKCNSQERSKMQEKNGVETVVKLIFVSIVNGNDNINGDHDYDDE